MSKTSFQKLIFFINFDNQEQLNLTNKMKRKLDLDILNNMSKDPGNWKGPFYINKKDPRLTVPKQNPSLGFTFNFASPFAYLMILAIIIILIGFALLS